MLKLPKDDLVEAERIATVAINKLIKSEVNLGTRFALKKIPEQTYFAQKRVLYEAQLAIRNQFFALRNEIA